MKLKSAQVEQVLDKLPSEVIPENHPTVPELESVFGQHTFFLGQEGLHVVERTSEDAEPIGTAYVVKVASWTDDKKTSLRPQEAEVTDTVELAPDSEGDFLV
ncbi:MAG TPA: hypothetical protein VGJ75_09350 [Dongiaceae bacterium]|jgi:hypothetical protein